MAQLAVVEIPKKESAPKRRGARGLGSIYRPTYRAADGSTKKTKTYWIQFKDETGQRIKENSYCTTIEGARDLLKQRLAAIAKGEFVDWRRYKDVTLKQVNDDLRAQYVANGRRTSGKLDRSLGRLETYFGKDFAVVNLTPDRIQAYRAARIEDESKPSGPTVSRELAALKAALRLGYKNDKVKKVPHIEIPDERERARDGEFSPEQMAALLKELPPPVAPLVQFLYRTGMRIEEPLGMKWVEVRLDLRTLRLPGRRTKNKEAKPLTLDGDVLAIVQKQRGDETKPSRSEYLFPGEDGDRMTYDFAHWHFQKACKAAGIADGFTDGDGAPRKPAFHDLRRTFARRADRCGVPHTEIMRIAGWKTHAMLMRYLGASETRMRDAFKLMDAAFDKPKLSPSSPKAARRARTATSRKTA